jgi:DeoR family fructose operon transcriptional repressor
MKPLPDRHAGSQDAAAMSSKRRAPITGRQGTRADGQSKSLFVEERKARILELLSEREKVTVAELCTLFNVSGGTIRSDLNDLDASGLLIKTHGGAIRRTKAAFEPKTGEREVYELAAKQSIAKAALELIEDGDVILLDAGTTVFELARIIGSRRSLNIVTNDMHTADFLEKIPGMSVFLIGGLLRQNFHCVVGTLGIELLSKITVDTAFMGTNSFSVQKGATSPDIQQAEIRSKMIECAKRVVLLCDHTKVGKTSFAQSVPTDRIDVLITDHMSNEEKAELEESGVKVVVTSQEAG